MIQVTTVLAVHGGPAEAAEFHDMATTLQDELMELDACNDDISDAVVSSNAEFQRFEVEIIVHRDDPLEAIQLATTVVRTALHAAGASTPQWPTVVRVENSSAELVDA